MHGEYPWAQSPAFADTKGCGLVFGGHLRSGVALSAAMYLCSRG